MTTSMPPRVRPQGPAPALVPGPLARALQVQVPAHWSYIDVVRNFAVAYGELRFGPRVAERLGVVAQELLENAIKYGETAANIDVELSQSSRIFQLSVMNQTLPARALHLRKLVKELNELPAEAAFRAALERVDRHPSSRSGLGLVRVRLEAEVELECVGSGETSVLMLARGRVS